jgi:2-hydroxy-3-oxopropionate reductase
VADTVGFIGLGIMGKPMAQNLIEAGYDLVVYNRTREKAEELDGATVAESPRAVAEQSDIIITMLPDSPQVEEVLAGEDGVFEGIQEGALIVDMSTISPVVTEELSQQAQERGASMLDAPVSGGDVGAIDGTLSIMVGGSEEDGRYRHPRRSCRDGAGRQGGEPDRRGAHHRGRLGGAGARLEGRGPSGENP